MPLSAPAPAQYIETLRSRIVEGRTLNPYQYRPVVVPLQVTLGSSRRQGTATFNIPTNQRFIVRQFIPIVVPLSVTDAADAMSGTFVGAVAPGAFPFTGTVEDLLFMKSQNCKIDLQLNSQMYNLFIQSSFPLSDLTSWSGGGANLKDMPGIMPQGTTINLTASLSDVNAAGADTQYGMLISGLYVQV
jgi:hypothetical protein